MSTPDFRPNSTQSAEMAKSADSTRRAALEHELIRKFRPLTRPSVDALRLFLTLDDDMQHEVASMLASYAAMLVVHHTHLFAADVAALLEPATRHQISTSEPIDTTNKCLVGAQGKGVVFVLPPPRWLSTDDALLLAAWLVAVTGEPERFQQVLDAVLAT